MSGKDFNIRAVMFLSAALLFWPHGAKATGLTDARLSEPTLITGEANLASPPALSESPDVAATEAPIPPQPVSPDPNIAATSENEADVVISPGDFESQVGADMTDEPEDTEADDFFAKASEEVEKGKNGEFAGLANPIDKFIRYFTDKGRNRMELYLSRSGRYRDMMQGILSEYGLPEDLIYLALIESGFSPRAYSSARAAGPWQFIAGTGRRYGLRIDWWIDERRDAEKSTHAAAGYLKDLYGMFESWPLAAAAYNAGEGKISKAITRYKSDDFAELIRHKYLAQETKDYVPKMLAALAIAKEPEKYGFTDIEYEEPLNLQTVVVPGGIDLIETARIIEVSYEDIRDWNHELRRFCTPPNQAEYSLRLPEDAVFRAMERMDEIREQAKVAFLQHNVRPKETLGKLADKYGASPEAIRELNGLRTDSLLRVSQLVIPVTGLSGSDAVPGHEVDPVKIMAARMKAEEAKRRTRGYAGYSVRPNGKRAVRIQKGQTLSGIARENGVSLAALARANGLSANAKLKAGAWLSLPEQKKAAASPKGRVKSAQSDANKGDTL